ncbi:MAG: mobile mystery protein A [Pseudoxanthomonas sp.]
MKTLTAKDLARASLDQRLLALETVRSALTRPRQGWVRSIRTALGMTTTQLGRRLGIAQASVVGMEKAEAEDRIQLGTLRRAAEALDCELHYVLLPRTGLQARVEQRRAALAEREHGRLTHSMGLERQHESDPVLQALQLRATAEGLRDRDLWEAD